MKKITIRRRMLSLTLAASVALPQASSAFAASLWNEDGENDHITQVIESSVSDTQESSMPWITLPSDDKTSQQPEAVDQTSPKDAGEKAGEDQPGADQPEPPTTAREDETTRTPASTETGGSESTPAAEGEVPSSAGVTTKPTPEGEPTRGEGEASQEVTTPVSKPEDDLQADRETVPDQEELLPDKGESNTGLSTDENLGGEGISAPEEDVSTALATEADSALLVQPYSAPDGVKLSQWMYYRLGYGVKLAEEAYSNALYDLGYRFNVESPEADKDKAKEGQSSIYGYRDYGNALSVLNPNPNPPNKYPINDQYSLCVFPSAEALGRVPDQQFVGWYVYPSGAKKGQSADAARSWHYEDKDASDMGEVTLSDYGPLDPGYDNSYSNSYSYPGDGTFGSLGDKWDGGKDYGYGYHVRRDKNTGAVLYSTFDSRLVAYGDGKTEDNRVSFVGRWEPSDESRASSIKASYVVDGETTELKLYSSSVVGKPLGDEGVVTAQNQKGLAAAEYYLRVPADVDTISLDLSTLELYYKDYDYKTDTEETDDDKKDSLTDKDYKSFRLDPDKSHVQVTTTFNKVTTSYTDSEHLSAVMLPRWEVKPVGTGGTVQYIPENSDADGERAHSEWTVEGIRLQPATAETQYNDITITVTSPSGDETTTYILHVQRLTEPTIVRDWGNTPVGMIHRATNENLKGEAAKNDAVADFEENRKFHTVNYPAGEMNQDGAIFRDSYVTYAWPENNDVDTDPTAIVVYLDSVFRDPGISSLTDSEGKPVDITKGNLYRSLKLKQVDVLDVTRIGKDVGTTCWYRTVGQDGELLSEDDSRLMENGAFSKDLTFEQLSQQNGTDVIDLRGKNILPGIYTIEYRYSDPIDGKTYPGGYATEVGEEYQDAYTRTLVVLPTPGDVDMDGAVTMADALALSDSDVLGTQNTTGYTTLNGVVIRSEGMEKGVAVNDAATLFAYRVCDVNHDGMVNRDDIDALKKLPNPKTVSESNASNSDYFYIPLPTGQNGERYQRVPLAEETADVAKLEMVFLGKEGGKQNEKGYLDNPTGPWNSLKEPENEGSDPNRVELGNIFWLGVKLTNKDKMEPMESVKSFTITLAYDSYYLEPAVVLNQDEWDGQGIPQSGTDEEKLWARWVNMIKIYNLYDGATANGKKQTVWSKGVKIESDYALTDATGFGRRFTTHYSTAVIPLESVPSGLDAAKRLQTVTFSVELTNEGTPINLNNQEGDYLFAVPFCLINHPFNKTTARLVEVEAGMRGLTLVGADSKRTTYVYSAQETIFGGTSKNLSSLLPCSASGVDIPLGKDNSTVYTIYNFAADASGNSDSETNGMYESKFESRGGWIVGEAAEGLSDDERYQRFPLSGNLTGGSLPQGLTYHASTGYIDGVPEETGEFSFNIGSVKYRMVIDKAPLHFWAVKQSSYYGQTEFRGIGNREFTFEYAADDIRGPEKKLVVSNKKGIASGENLAVVLGNDSDYNAHLPNFTAVTKDGAPVTFSTPVGVYEIRNTLCPQSNNYEFIYDTTRMGTGTGLTILERPIRVEYINGTPEDPTVVAQIYSDDVGKVGNLVAWQGSDLTAEQKVTFTAGIARGTGQGNEDGYYSHLPLTAYDNYVDGAILPGDSIQIVYTANYERNEKDKARFPDSTLFALDGQTEFRDVRVSGIELAGGINSENYILVGTTPVEPVREDAVVGQVDLRRILSLRISQPPPLDYEYGDVYTGANELHYYILKDGDAKEGEYRYSDDSVKSLGISVYWATEEEYLAYQAGRTDYNYSADGLPLSEGQSFTTDYDNRYLCMSCHSVDQDGQSVIIRQYEYEVRNADGTVVESKPLHLTVRKKDLVLTATPGSRYYGEKNNNLTFTYEPRQLALQDQRQGLTGAGEELRELLEDQEKHDYTEPTLKAVRRLAEEGLSINTPELTAESRYTGGNDSVIIYGAQSKNYRFLYSFVGEKEPREDFGTSVYRIEKRPIVVDQITKIEPLVNIYADTHRIDTEGMTLQMKDAALGLPEHTENSSRYYYNGRQTAETPSIGFAPESTAIANGDNISFTYTATVIPTDGSDYIKYIDFSRGYFNMDEGVTDGYKEYPVQVSKLGLGKTPIENEAGVVTGYVEDNYILVYRTSSLAVNQTPTRVETIEGFVPEGSESQHYHYHAAVVGEEDGQPVVGVGRVYLRPIAKISIESPGRLNYTYGDTYNPSQGEQGDLNGSGMRIHIEYEKDRIIDGHSVNNYDGNPTVGTVDFRMAGIQGDKVTTSFDNRSLKIYYVKEGQTGEEAIALGQELDLRSQLYVKEHTGAGLVVSGKRGDQKVEIVSELGAGSDGTLWTLQVAPKTLNLRPKDQRRVYGEKDPEFDFTFPAGELVSWDRQKLDVTEGQQVPGVRLAEVDASYQAPTYKTTAVVNSDVKNGGREGYPIVKDKEGSLDNYAFAYEQQGTLYIYPRPVRIAGITQEEPIYTIFSDVPGRLYYTSLMLDPNNKEPKLRNQFTLALPEGGTYTYGSGSERVTLPVSGEAFLSDDAMTLRVQVVYPGDLNLQGGIQNDIPVTVQNVSIVPGTRAASNYMLMMIGNDAAFVDNNNKAKGRVEIRNIATISVLHAPKITYTYGEILDLSGLEIAIDYEGDGQSRERVPYVDAAYFEQYGLHVYYYDYPTLQEDRDSWEYITEKSHRPAATGDHLTIAPTHDTQTGAAKDRFAANGKYLIITAQIPGKDPSEPKIIPLAGEEDSQDLSLRSTPARIKVNPKEITYTLTAEDKVYDGTVQAAGTIAFTNIFNQTGIVDNWNRNGVTDIVYPVTGATYENIWADRQHYGWGKVRESFESYVNQKGYSFTTGSYVANDPEKLTENEPLTWTDGYQWGTGLTFAYGDPNVAYAPGRDFTSAPVSKTVTVSGLRLAGEDAANYTLVGKKMGETVAVTANTATGLEGGLPQAVIHKANRAPLPDDLLPQVEVDPHTNVVRLTYDQSLTMIPGEKGPEEQEYQSELHFEYALQKLEVEKSPADPEGSEEGTEGAMDGEVVVSGVVQWAGADGKKTWETDRFFGGEVRRPPEITSEDPEVGPYTPKEEDIPKAESVNENTTLKGQVYQWSELDDGFTLDLEAYPGGVYWPGYELYATDRAALDRDAVYIPVVRAAETHNYYASLPLSSVEGYTYDKIHAILEAQAALSQASTVADREEALEALATALEAAQEPLNGAVGSAQAEAQSEVDALMAAGEKGNKLEERPVRAASSAVKTYKQAIETVSVKAYQGASEDKNKKGDTYQVPILEAVWFTDVEELPSKEVLDAVVWNTNPTRYRRYGYDSAFAAELKFTEEPISLRGSSEIEIPRKGEEGPELIRFNEDNNARFYVDTTFPSSGGSINPDLMVIRPGGIMALLGDKPVLLEAVFYPAWTRPAVVQWSSSDPTVAIVDNQGRVSFVGIGTAVITAIVPGGYSGAEPVCSASITVTVAADWKKDYPNSIFDFGNQDAFLISGTGAGGESDRLFKPEMGITRGETAKLLAQFYVSNPSWSKHGPEDFSDLTGEEDYAEAAKLLGHLGVFMGYPEGDFAGDQYISRAEFVTLLARMTGLNIVDTAGQAHAFLDTGEEDTWAYAEIDALSRQTGILYGVGEGYFAPDRSITRSEVAALLVRLLRFPVTQEKEELIVPIDVEEEYWARECILRAVNGSRIVEKDFLWDDL